MNTGQPNGWKSLVLLRRWLLNVSIGAPCSPLGTLFHMSTASKTAKGQRAVVTFPGHLHAASIIMLRDNSDTVLMCRSATPF